MLTNTSIVERSAATFNVVSARPIDSLLSLVRVTEDGQEFALEYRDGFRRCA